MIRKSWISTRRPAWAPPPKIWIIGIGSVTWPPSATRCHRGWPLAAAAVCNAAIETAIVAFPPSRALFGVPSSSIILQSIAARSAIGIERSAAAIRDRKNEPLSPTPALQRAARAAMRALLQLIGEPPDDQITTEAQRRSGVMQCPPGTPQLLCRSIDQSRDFAIKLG